MNHYFLVFQEMELFSRKMINAKVELQPSELLAQSASQVVTKKKLTFTVQ